MLRERRWESATPVVPDVVFDRWNPMLTVRVIVDSGVIHAHDGVVPQVEDGFVLIADDKQQCWQGRHQVEGV